MNDNKKNIRRGDIFYADLSPVVGSEQGGIRPVLILQNNVGNRHSPTVIVCAITGKTEKNNIPTHVCIGTAGGCSKESFALLEQIRTIDRIRLREKVGTLSGHEMKQINQALSISVGLDPAFF
ncbi:MAG TPA: PemK family transcriptional regulator [Ruminococcaceae bacterium]|nr:PemK family transcriptional regulator [Oscillospiraceae bacterium]